MKYISFSLFGSNPLYCQGALENLDLQQRYFSDWRCIFYVDDSVPIEVRRQLKRKAMVVKMPRSVGCAGIIWRLQAILREGCEAMICRDADSQLHLRDSKAVAQWLHSGKTAHIIRDHPRHSPECTKHGWPIMGGCFGLRRLPGKNLNWVYPHSELKTHYGHDQDWLRDTVWPEIKDDCYIHDFNAGTFPPDGPDYVGEKCDRRRDRRRVSRDRAARRIYGR